MRSIRKNVLALAVLLTSMTVAYSQSATEQKEANSQVVAMNNAVSMASFKVLGNCGMCKKTIENSLKIKGVESAVWNKETKQIEIAYAPKKVSEDKLHELIAGAGYDTEKVKAKDEVYSKLPGCCQYDRSGFDKKESNSHAGHSH